MLLWGLYIDLVTIVLIIATLIISGAAQLFIRSQPGTYGAVGNGAGLSGVPIGERGRSSCRPSPSAGPSAPSSPAVTSTRAPLHHLASARR